MKAKDVMEPLREYLTPGLTLKDAIHRMRGAKRNTGLGPKGLVVLDSNGNLVGMLSIKDILRVIIPSYISLMELGNFTWDGMLEDMARRVAGRKVEEVMSTEVITVDPDAPLMECADLVVKHNLQRLPVVDDTGRVAGILYVRDLYYAIVRALMDKEEDE